MKKTLLKIFATLFVCSTLAFGFTACKDKDNTNASTGGGTNTEQSASENNSSSDSSNNSTNEEIDTNNLSFKTLSLDSLNVYGCVSNTITEFSFVEEIEITGNTKFSVSKDKYGSQIYLTKIVPLEIGDNSFYIFEMLDDEIINTYTVTLRRRPIYTVSFNTNHIDNEIPNQTVEEDSLAIKPQNPIAVGGTFQSWDYDFAQPITSSITINATWNFNFDEIFVVENDTIKGLTEIGKSFSIDTLSIPSQINSIEIKTIGSSAFENCNFSQVVCPDSITTIEESAFKNCINLTSICLPKNITKICGYTFYGCERLKSIYIPNNVTIIENGAFANCIALQDISLPENLISLGDGIVYYNVSQSAINPFYNCENLPYLEYQNVRYLGNEVNPYMILITTTNPTLEQYEIHNDTICINAYAFNDCDNLTSITIPENIKSIGPCAFNGKLKNVQYNTIECICINAIWQGRPLPAFDGSLCITVGSNVRKIGESAFYECTNLTSVTIPDSVTSIGDYAFAGCTNLTSVTISDSVTAIGVYAFADCTNLTDIEVSSENNFYKSIDGNLYTKDGTVLIQYAVGKNTTSFIIPDGITLISDYAFGNCASLTSITIPDSITSIGDFTFYHCENLASIIIPDGVTSIGDYAFAGCGNLASVTIPDNITYIGESPFLSCPSLSYYSNEDCHYLGNSINNYIYLLSYDGSATSPIIHESCKFIDDYAFADSGLTSITIPSSVISIGDCAFIYTNMTSITVDEDNQYYKSIDGVLYTKDGTTLIQYPSKKAETTFTIPDNVTTISSYAFFDCNNLITVTLPNSVTYIGNDAFRSCDSLINITLPETMISIEDFAFIFCNIESITIPDGIITIGDGCFYQCENLTSIIIPNSVQNIGVSAFVANDNLNTIFYIGTEREWDEIVIESDNPSLNNATIYYYIENEMDLPLNNGNYWHYVDGVATPWVYAKEE